MKISFSKVQALVGLTAGLLSITGALAAFFRPASNQGVLVAIVKDGKTGKPLPDATIEILTPADVLVTTKKSNGAGEASCTLDEGRYRVRISHEGYPSEVRDIQLMPTQNTELHVQLRAGRSFGSAIRGVFHH